MILAAVSIKFQLRVPTSSIRSHRPFHPRFFRVIPVSRRMWPCIMIFEYLEWNDMVVEARLCSTCTTNPTNQNLSWDLIWNSVLVSPCGTVSHQGNCGTYNLTSYNVISRIYVNFSKNSEIYIEINWTCVVG